MHILHLRSMGSVLSELARHEAYSEYMDLIEKVFGDTHQVNDQL